MNGVLWDVTPFFIVTAVKTSNLTNAERVKYLFPKGRNMLLNLSVDLVLSGAKYSLVVSGSNINGYNVSSLGSNE
jgi:hypothetical protein